MVFGKLSWLPARSRGIGLRHERYCLLFRRHPVSLQISSTGRSAPKQVKVWGFRSSQKRGASWARRCGCGAACTARVAASRLQTFMWHPGMAGAITTLMVPKKYVPVVCDGTHVAREGVGPLSLYPRWRPPVLSWPWRHVYHHENCDQFERPWTCVNVVEVSQCRAHVHSSLTNLAQ